MSDVRVRNSAVNVTNGAQPAVKLLGLFPMGVPINWLHEDSSNGSRAVLFERSRNSGFFTASHGFGICN
jgi:hypothetical protein